MPYVEGFTVHDADSHVMELPGTLDSYLTADARERFAERAKPLAQAGDWADKARRQHDDPEFRAGDEEGVSAHTRRRFYRDNFIDLMGAGIEPSLHDSPHRREPVRLSA